MLWKLDPAWLMMAVALVTVLSFFFGSIMDAIMPEDGFGPVGNMAVISGRFFCGDTSRQLQRVRHAEPHLRHGDRASSGAFLILAALALLKAGAGPSIV